MKRQELLALGLCVVVLASLVAFTQPVSAGDIQLDGPDRVGQSDDVSLNSTVILHEKGGIDSYSLNITDGDGETMTVTFAANGTVLDVQPNQTATIDGDSLRESLNVTTVQQVDGATGQVGYAGDSDGETVAYRIEFNSTAFAPGTYDVRMNANVDGESVFSSNEHAVTVDGPEASSDQ